MRTSKSRDERVAKIKGICVCCVGNDFAYKRKLGIMEQQQSVFINAIQLSKLVNTC